MALAESLDPWLLPDELGLLSGSFATDGKPRIEQNENAVRIVPSGVRWVMLSVVIVFTLTISAEVYYLAVVRNNTLGPVEKRFAKAALLFVGLMAVTGGLGFETLRSRHLKALSPLLELDFLKQVVTLRNGEARLSADQVYCILGLVLRQSDEDDYCSELQLVVSVGGVRGKYLIASHYSGSLRGAFGDVLQEFGERTGFLTLTAKPSGMFQRGPLKIEVLAPNRREQTGRSSS